MNIHSGKLWTICLIGALLATVGCQRTQRASPLITEYDPNDTTAELDFWHGLADLPLTTNNDAFHGLIIYANDADPNLTYEDRLAWLVEQGHLDAGFDGQADEAVGYGTIARIMASILDIKGGLTMRLIGPHPRYALRELTFLRIIPTRSVQQGVPGIEFLSIISRARRYQETTS